MKSRCLLPIAGFLMVGLVCLRTSAQTKESRLNANLRRVVPSLPMYGQSVYVTKGVELRPKNGAIEVNDVSGAMTYPANDKKPPLITFKLTWHVEEGGRKPLTEKQMESRYKYHAGIHKAPKAVEGAFGPFSFFQSSVMRGTLDPAASGDPYIGSAHAHIDTPCGSLNVWCTIGIFSDASHGGRNRPEVMQAIQEAAERHCRDGFNVLLPAVQDGCEDGDTTTEVPKEKRLQAAAECESVTLIRGKLPSESCGIYVKNWPPNRAVSTCFPDLIDAWGSLPNGIVTTFANEFFHVGAVVARGRTSDEYYLPLWWYARCQAKPGTYMVTVYVQEGGPVSQIGGCPPSNNRATVTFKINVSEEMSPNCTPRPSDGAGGQGGGQGGGGQGGGGQGGGGQGGGGGGNPFTGKTWRTNFGDLALQEDAGGKIRGTLGADGAVVTGKIKDNEFIGEFVDKAGDGLIHLTTPDGKGVWGEWERKRGPGAGTHGRVDGTSTDTPGGQGPGGPGPGGPGPGGQGPGGPAPGGPGTNVLPPLAPFPASVSKLTLQAPELRVAPGKDVVVPILLLNANDVVNMNWNLSYDSRVAVTPANPQMVRMGYLLSGPFEANPLVPNIVRLGFAQAKGVSGSGPVSELRFQAIGPPGSKTPLTLAVPMITDSRPQKLPIDLIHGYIEVIDPGSQIPGSSGGGPGITMKDAYDALKMSVGLLPENLNADMDRDGRVSSLDAYLIMTRVFLYMQRPKT